MRPRGFSVAGEGLFQYTPLAKQFLKTSTFARECGESPGAGWYTLERQLRKLAKLFGSLACSRTFVLGIQDLKCIYLRARFLTLKWPSA